MNPILEDEDVLVSLDELPPQITPNGGVFNNEYENRIAKHKQSKGDDTHKLTRQHSIELYERENHTFRGYSFLIDNANAGVNQ